MIICAFDIGISNVGCVVIESGQLVVSQGWKATDLDIEDKIRSSTKFYNSIIEIYKPNLILIEKPSGSKSANAIKSMWCAYTVALSSSYNYGIKTECHNILTIKAWMNRNYGRKDKSVAKEEYRKALGIDNKVKVNEHIADAYMLWKYYEHKITEKEIC